MVPSLRPSRPLEALGELPFEDMLLSQIHSLLRRNIVTGTGQPILSLPHHYVSLADQHRLFPHRLNTLKAMVLMA
jgi:hypothetical protein